MKKILSTLLVGSMLLAMAPAFSVFGAAADYSSIDTVDEYLAMVAAANDDDATNDPTGTVTVTADELDFAGKDYEPIMKANFNIDFGGATIKNLDVTVAQADCYNTTYWGYGAGLIANYLGNGKVIKNVTIADSTLTVNAEGADITAGGVIGANDRGYFEAINLDGVKIVSNANGSAGALVGNLMWSYDNDADITLASELDVEIDAANCNVGIIGGKCNDGSVTLNLNGVSGTVEVTASKNVVMDDTYVGSGTVQDNSTYENVTVSIEGGNAEEAAIEAALKEIDTAEELAQLSERLAEKGADYRAGETIKVTADLDFDGVDYTPIVDAKFTLDFQGHTVSNLDVTTDGVTLDGKTCAGLIANSLTNDPKGQIYNVTLKDCTLTTTAQYVGGVVGGANRGSADNVTLENVTINATGAQYIGGVMGFKWWGCTHPDMTATLKNVTINAGENTVVALMVGTLDGAAQYGGAKLNVTGLTVDGLTVTGAAAPDADEYLGANRVAPYTNAETGVTTTTESHYTVAEDAEIVVDLDGDGESEGEGSGEGGQNPAPTGDAMVLAVVLAVLALAGVAVVSKKRSAC